MNKTQQLMTGVAVAAALLMVTGGCSPRCEEGEDGCQRGNSSGTRSYGGGIFVGGRGSSGEAHGTSGGRSTGGSFGRSGGFGRGGFGGFGG